MTPAEILKTGPWQNRRTFLKATTLAGVTALMEEGVGIPRAAGQVAASTPAATQSSVGSLYPFIQSQTVKGEFPLSFLNAKFHSLQRWKRTARNRVLELLHYAPPPVDPKPETHSREDCGDYWREQVSFNTTPDIRVPAMVLVPKLATKRLPAIVALHDHGGFYLWGREKLVAMEGENPVLGEFRQQYYHGRSIGIELVRQGYLVVIIDMFYWGERRMQLEDDPDDWKRRKPDLSRERIQAFNRRAGQSESLVGRTIYSAGFTWPGVMFWDDIRTVDYLLTRADVDPSRIGCVGLSVGGLRSCHLAALDDRIRASVVVGWMTSFPTQIRKKIENTIGHTKLIPGLYREMDYPDVAAMAAPTPMLVINGSQDSLFDPVGVENSFAKLNACYLKAGHPERCLTRLYDTPHEFNPTMQAEAWQWLKRWV
jgi:dienelactone hydrolase